MSLNSPELKLKEPELAPPAPPASPAKAKKIRTKRILAIDLGGWTTKAVHMERSADGLHLINYLLQPSPFLDNEISRESLSEHLRQIGMACGGKTKRVVLVLSMNQGIVRQVNFPDVSPGDLRKILRLNATQFVQQTLANCAVDVCLTGLPEAPEPGGAQNSGKPAGSAAKNRSAKAAIVGVLPEELLALLEESCSDAGLILEEVTLSQIGLVNAALWGLVAVEKGVTAMVDVGFRCSTITILWDGQVALNRVVSTGGDTITAQLADEMNATYRVAEAIKVSLPERAQAKLGSAVKTLCDELRIAIDYFEHTYERPVTKAFISGAGASSSCMMETLQSHLRIPCQPVSPHETLSLRLPNNHVANMEAHSPQLAPALGAAASRLEMSGLRLNFLAEKEVADYLYRRDPVRWAKRISIGCFSLLLLWVAFLGIKLGVYHFQHNRLQQKFGNHSAAIGPFEAARQEIARNDKLYADLNFRATNRFFWTGPLDALREVIIPGITVVKLSMTEQISYTAGTKKTNVLGTVIGSPPASSRYVVLTIIAKKYGSAPLSDQFVNTIASHPWFKTHLRERDSVLLRERQPEQVDPLNPARTFRLIRIECHFQPITAYDE